MKSLPLLILLIATVAWAELPSAGDVVVKQALASGRPTVINLGARTCIPCTQMAPMLEALVVEYRERASILFIDIHKDSAAAEKFRVRMIPTQIFFNARGKEVRRHTGYMEKEDIVRELKTAGLK
jgi:thioredoxin 1